MKKIINQMLVGVGLLMSMNAQAGIPVIDATNLAQQVQQVVAWGKQYLQMEQEFEKLQQTYNSLNGVRGMASLVNNPALRKYLPSNYQEILNNGYGNYQAIRQASKLAGIEDTNLDPNSDIANAFESNANQVAINRAVAEEGYKQASNRFDAIQVLLDKINDAPESKDIADLQSRIQAEQVMMQNEQTKLMMLSQLAQAQRDIAQQQSKEIVIKALKGNPPRF
jgi:type IV secretion system protein VirB5